MYFSMFTLFMNLIYFALSDGITDCPALGFNNTVLKCSSCNLLSKYNLDVIRDDCLQCCLLDKEESFSKRYAKARLEICTCKFGAYPQIQAFVKSDLPNQYPNLQIRYVHGRDPIIKLIDESGEVKEVVAIEKWNTDSVDEFLRTHLEQETKNYLKTNMI